jgi:hypothetical protein
LYLANLIQLIFESSRYVLPQQYILFFWKGLILSITTKIAWLLLATVHALPAIVLFKPKLLQQLYGVAPHGEIEILLVHRAALFLAVVAVALLAAFEPMARRAAAIVVSISIICFVMLYARAGFPSGPLKTIAAVDLIAMLPLLWVCYDVLKPSAT